MQEGTGDGYWKHPEYSHIQGRTFAIYYSLHSTPGSIENYLSREEWMEIAEASYDNKILELSKQTLSGISFGMERIEYEFFNIPYPDKEKGHQTIQTLSTEV